MSGQVEALLHEAGVGPDAARKDVGRQETVIRVYRRRWLMLALFILYSTTINGQWVEYSIISNLVTR